MNTKKPWSILIFLASSFCLYLMWQGSKSAAEGAFLLILPLLIIFIIVVISGINTILLFIPKKTGAYGNRQIPAWLVTIVITGMIVSVIYFTAKVLL